MARFMDGVSLDSLPLTFREAAEVVRGLGIRYLWIDCYCIIQGGSDEAREDWSREVDKMRRVYMNSSLNIAAADSNGPDGALFRNRNVQDAKNNFIQWQPTKDAPRSCYALFGKRDGGSNALALALDTLRQEPLMKRGWVVQEVILSPRMLSFTSNQAVWQCLQSAACEDAPSFADAVLHDQNSFQSFWAFADHRRTSAATRDLSITLPIKNPTTPSLVEQWLTALETYSGSSLSFPDKDIYNAIDGVGELAALLTNDTYEHGMLRRSLPISLLWQTSNKDCRRSPSTRAPSWHWASYEGDVSFTYCRDWYYTHDDELRRAKTYALAHIFWRAGIGSTDLWPLAMCIGRPLAMNVSKDGSDSTWDPGERESRVKVQLADSTVQIEAQIDWEGQACGRDGEFVYLPLLTGNTRAQISIQMYSALILRKTKDGNYERVGVGCPSEWTAHNVEELDRMISRRKPELIILE
ncbi:putative Heterokaryon incompatibility domain-containing protein [Seiridium unicorne]|uniref:Heterokaryon incompatibility domain-containing protein n=1 Tax=Seiridium unicorne TaxID=138068 RepID=A0ABR2UN36_9PEZI